MGEADDRRTFLDPRYVNRREWEDFQTYLHRTLEGMQHDEELYRSRVSGEVAELSRQVTGLRVQLARLAVYISVGIGTVGLLGGPLITWALVHH